MKKKPVDFRFEGDFFDFYCTICSIFIVLCTVVVVLCYKTAPTNSKEATRHITIFSKWFSNTIAVLHCRNVIIHTYRDYKNTNVLIYVVLHQYFKHWYIGIEITKIGWKINLQSYIVYSTVFTWNSIWDIFRHFCTPKKNQFESKV